MTPENRDVPENTGGTSAAQQPGEEQRRGRRRTAATATAGLLAVIGVTSVVLGVQAGGADTVPPTPPAAASPSTESAPELTGATGATGATDETGVPAPTGTPLASPVQPAPPSAAEAAEEGIDPLPPSEPVSVRVPGIDVQSSIVELGRNPDGTMETPSDPAKTGWYTGSPTPGSLGPSVLAGHVTWNGDESVFFRLGELREGDEVEVTREDGKTAVFAVTRVEEHPKDEFPTVEVYSNTDHAALRLITCAGEFDADRRYYDSNLIVFAELVDVRV